MAQDWDTVATWSCLDRASCEELDVCLDVPVNPSCQRGCASFETCGVYPYYGRMGGLPEMPPIEGVCSRWCDGQVALGDNAELVGHMACYADALGPSCDGISLFDCGDGLVLDCETACASIDTCSAEVPGAFGTSAACEAHCGGLEPGAQGLFADCVGSESCDPATDPTCVSCDPATDPDCGFCEDTSRCEQLPEAPSPGCARACEDVLALCAPRDRVGDDLCPWGCTEDEEETAGLGEFLASCTEGLTECVDLGGESGESAGRWGDSFLYCFYETSEDCRTICSYWAPCSAEPGADEAAVRQSRFRCDIDCSERTGQDTQDMIGYIQSLDPGAPGYCDEVVACYESGACAPAPD